MTDKSSDRAGQTYLFRACEQLRDETEHRRDYGMRAAEEIVRARLDRDGADARRKPR